MSVDFPSASYPANSVSTGKPVDAQTLQETFAAVLRSYGMEKGEMQTNTMIEVLTSSSDNADDDRNQRQQDNQQHTHRNDFTQIDRKLLDKSEIRHNEMNADQQGRIDRHEMFRNDYHTKVERRESQHPAIPASPSLAVTPTSPPLDHARPNELPPNRDSAPQPKEVPVIADANSPLPPTGVAAPNHGAVDGSAGVAIPMGANVPTMPTSAAPQIVPPQTFTVFTASRRFGQMQEKSDEKENDDEQEESTEEKPVKKKQPFAIFNAIHAEATRPVRQNRARQPQEPSAPTEARQVTKKLHEKQSENENVKTVKTLEEFLNAPQQVVVPKKGEPQPDQTQYLHRIAAAAEAASHYAPIRIKINLDHLGTLTLRFFHKADKLMLRFETPSKESARFLRDHLGGLKAILSERNVQLASVEMVLTKTESADSEN